MFNEKATYARSKHAYVNLGFINELQYPTQYTLIDHKRTVLITPK